AHRLRVGAELVRAAPARDQEGVEIVCLYIFERLVDSGFHLAFVALDLGPGFESDDRYLVAGLAEGAIGLFELGILELRPEHASNLHPIPPPSNWSGKNHLTLISSRVCPDGPVGKFKIGRASCRDGVL